MREREYGLTMTPIPTPVGTSTEVCPTSGRVVWKWVSSEATAVVPLGPLTAESGGQTPYERITTNGVACAARTR